MSKLNKAKAPVVLAAMAKQIEQDRIDDAKQAIEEVRKKALPLIKIMAKSIKQAVNSMTDEELVYNFGLCVRNGSIQNKELKDACQDLLIPYTALSSDSTSKDALLLYPRCKIAFPRKFFPKTFADRWEDLTRIRDRIMRGNNSSFPHILDQVKREVTRLGGLEAMEYSDQLLVDKESKATIKKLCKQLNYK